MTVVNKAASDLHLTHFFPPRYPTPAAERASPGLFGLLPVRRAAGSRRPEEQQAEPAGCEPVEPQPQIRILRDSRIGEFLSPLCPPALLAVANLAVSPLLCRSAPWSPSNSRPSSPTWPTWQTRCRGWPCSPAPERHNTSALFVRGWKNALWKLWLWAFLSFYTNILRMWKAVLVPKQLLYAEWKTN